MMGRKAPSIEDIAFARFLPFCAYSFPGFQDAPHHRAIARALERVERGETTRLMVNMPPRHGKSLQVSQLFPAWYLGRNPDRSVIASSYSQDLADDFGRRVRNLMNEGEYEAVFPQCRISKDSQAANRFSTTRGGAYFAAGAGGPITGRGAHLLLIDDPIKNREEADSALKRRRLREWYSSTAYTRLQPGGAVVVIQTRWHEDDLSGWLLNHPEAEEWEVLKLPAINAAGEALWPEAYSVEELHRRRAAVGPREWSALFQQEPAPDTGDYFRREWIRYYDTPPLAETLRIYGASDYAVTSKGGDWTVHLVVGVDPKDDIYILDVWREQTSPDVWIDAVITLAQRWRPVTWAEEQGQIIKSVGPFLSRRQQERGAYYVRKSFTSVSDKAARARSIQARMSMGKVLLPRSAPWLAEFESELISFPTGRHDDQVDALSLIGRLLADMLTGRSKAESTRRRGLTFDQVRDRNARKQRKNSYA